MALKFLFGKFLPCPGRLADIGRSPIALSIAEPDEGISDDVFRSHSGRCGRLRE